MNGDILFYCPCNGTKHYYKQSVLQNTSVYELGTGTKKTLANGVNGPFLRMPANAINFLFGDFLPTTLTIEWWQRNVGSYGCVIMPSAQSDSKKLQIQVSGGTSITFENRNGNLYLNSLDLPNNQWTHVAYTQDYVNSRVYAHVNGVFKNSASTNVNEFAWNLFCIGGKSSSVNSASEFFGGDIDEVIVTEGAKYPFEQNFTPSTDTPSITGLSEGGEDADMSEEYIANITIANTKHPIKAVAHQETNTYATIKEWIGTSAQYEALSTKDPNTIYHVTDDIGGYASPDVGKLTELINSKQDQCVHITETYDDGSYWYRVWSDGYCEQGGKVTYESGINAQAVSFLKPYRALPYVIATATTTNSSFVDGTVNIFNLTTTGFVKQYVKSVGAGWTWMARGYLA